MFYPNVRTKRFDGTFGLLVWKWMFHEAVHFLEVVILLRANIFLPTMIFLLTISMKCTSGESQWNCGGWSCLPYESALNKLQSIKWQEVCYCISCVCISLSARNQPCNKKSPYLIMKVLSRIIFARWMCPLNNGGDEKLEQMSGEKQGHALYSILMVAVWDFVTCQQEYTMSSRQFYLCRFK